MLDDKNISTKHAKTQVDETIQSENTSPDRGGENKLVRLIKSIVVNPERGRFLDEKVVKFKYYNSFNYSLLSREPGSVNLTIGITSARPAEGKTLVACNLGVSLAMGSQKKTILVDMNVTNPHLHRVFGITQHPGLADAFTNGQIYVSETCVENLSVLPIGNFFIPPETLRQSPSFTDLSVRSNGLPMLGLEQLPAFRDVIYSLEQEYEFIIVDMPSISSEGVPILFANQLNGLLVVVDSGKTKREDLDAMFTHINEHQVLGFVFNRIKPQQ